MQQHRTPGSVAESQPKASGGEFSVRRNLETTQFVGKLEKSDSRFLFIEFGGSDIFCVFCVYKRSYIWVR